MSLSCLDCGQRGDRVLCDLAPDALREFDGIKAIQTCQRGTVLFREGQGARSIFLLCHGRVRLSVCSENGSRMTLRVASAGEVLGLSAVLSGGSHEVTAEVLEPVQFAEVRRKDLLHFLRAHRDVCFQVVNLLSEDLHLAYDRVRSVGLTRTRHNHSHIL
jgi:CRP/FNR family cyclic AMP-dependent transcriptional regulator